MSHTTTSGRYCLRRPHPVRPGVRHRHLVAVHLQQHPQAVGRVPLSSTTSTRSRRAAGRGRRPAAGRPGPGGSAQRQADGERRAPAQARALGPRPSRRAARPAPSRSASPSPSPPLRAGRASGRPGRTARNSRGSMSGSIPTPVSRTDSTACPPRRLDAPPPPARRPAVNFSALVSRLSSTWASRVGSPLDPHRPSGTSTAGSARRPRRRPGGRPPPAGRRAARSSRSARSCTLPRVIREASSRSSTSRVRCVTCRSIIARASADHRRRRRRRMAEDLQGVADRGQRVAQLVGEHREELVLAAVGLLGPPARGRSRGRTGRPSPAPPRPGRPGPRPPARSRRPNRRRVR